MVAPRGLVRAGGERTVDHAEDQPELGMVDSHDDQTACVVPARAGPLADDPREVADVEGDHDATLARGELEQRFVVPAVERALLVGCSNVVSLLSQRASDGACGDVRVEEQAHLPLLDADRLDGGKLAP